jgi:protein-S-isoprenylcysteine O-methyltransferase Ste14
MLFKDEHDFSLLPKIVFMTAISGACLLAGYLMFADKNNLISFLKPYAINGNLTRQLIITFFCWFYVVRLFITNFIFLKRKMEWREMLFVSGLMSFALFSFARAGGNSTQSIVALDYFSIFLFLFGSWLNTWSEYTRYIWKKDERNKGRLYTVGLFKYSMHINYFGDVVLFTGFALITWKFSFLMIPFAMFLIFIFFIIPRLDKYLAEKYRDEFKEYASKTKKFQELKNWGKVN